MGIAQDLQRWQHVLLTVVVIVLGATGLLAYQLIGEMRSANQAVSYAHAERLIDADAMEIAVFMRSANTRGYLLTGDRSFLDHRAAAKLDLDRRVASLSQRGNVPRLAPITEAITTLDVASERAIQRYHASAQDARVIWEREARPAQEQLARHVGELVGAERAAFAAARAAAATASRQSTALLAALLGGVAILVTTLFYGYSRATRSLIDRQRHEQEQTTFRLLEQVPVGIFVLTAEGKPYYANQHAQKLLGRGVASASPSTLAETYEAYVAGTDQHYPTERLPVVRALAGETSECSDMEIRRGDEVVPLHVVGAPVRDGRGELAYAVAGFQDVRQLQRLAMVDTLTGLSNRAAIAQIYARERAVSSRAKRPFAIALIDLDRFKSINDTHGHASGDEVLKRTADTVVKSLRRSDSVGRWGGEEIVVLLPNTDAVGAANALEKSLADVRALDFVGKDGAKFTVTFSAGAVVADPDDSIDDAVARADALLYAAKAAGRNQVKIGTGAAS